MSKQTLEQRIATAINNPNAGSADLIELVSDVEAAITEAEATAKAERSKALDLVAAPNATEAHECATVAELRRDRLCIVLPKLQGQLAKALARERHERWDTEYNRIRSKRDAGAARLARVREPTDQIIAAYREAEEIDQEVDHLNSTAPDDEQRRLQSVEQKARNVLNFTRDNPSLLKVTQLYDFETGKQIWPPKQPAFAATYAAAMAPAHDPRFSADWWKVTEQDNVKRAAKTAEWNEAESRREAEAKRAYEASLRR